MPTPTTIEIHFPELGDSVHTVEVAEILVQVGDQVALDQALLEIETEKARVEVPSPHAGQVVQVHVATGDLIEVGTLLLTLHSVSSELGDAPRDEGNRTEGSTGHQLDLVNDCASFGPEQRRELSAMQQAAARQLSRSWHSVPQATHHDEADITSLEPARRTFNQQHAEKITLTSILAKVCAELLVDNPIFNSSLDVDKYELVLKGYYHIGIATDTEFGLVVPVIRDVDQKSLIQVAADVRRMAESARSRSLELEELRGGSFTISNLGGIGGTALTPIVNFPQVAILGAARARPQAVFVGKELVERLILPLSLSFDHRVINGADAARFMNRLTSRLSDFEIRV